MHVGSCFASWKRRNNIEALRNGHELVERVHYVGDVAGFHRSPKGTKLGESLISLFRHDVFDCVVREKIVVVTKSCLLPSSETAHGWNKYFATFTLNLQYAILPPVSQIFLVVLPILLFERRASGRRHQRLRVSAPELNLRHHELEELYNVLPSVPGNKLYPAIIALEAIVRTRVSKWMMANSPSSRISSPLLLVIRHEAAFAETSPLLVEEDKDSVKDCCKRMRDIVESFDVVSEGVAVVSVPVTGVDELAGGLPGLSLGLS
mmetsp:Transcript_34462/g.75428  ORF Transcript_34462/g.75428 Transcript_34462/m.75428 type:complete len:263 (+) Transcript_34462:287-1075(+)